MPPDILKYMRKVDIEAFAYTARWFNVYLLLRRSNPASIKRLGDPTHYYPKPADCKAKTAKANVRSARLGREIDVAGLVCDPTLPEFEQAYGAKWKSAVDIWQKKFLPFLREAYDDDGNRTRMYIQGRYLVDKRPDSPHYGAVMITPTGLVTAAKWVHGDYDLYGIVPASNPSVNIALTEEHLASPAHPLNLPPGVKPEDIPAEQHVVNCRGRQFTDVQMMLNRRMGVNMVLHGSQEKFSLDMDDKLDVFFPDGQTVIFLDGEVEIGQFYAKELKGRRLMSADPSSPSFGKPSFGKWRELG